MRIIETAIVTGSTGAIGHALCECLLKAGVRVFAIGRPGSARSAYVPVGANLRYVECDLEDIEQLPRLLARECADAFFHLAWDCTESARRNDLPAQVSNIRYTIDACAVAKDLGCDVFVGAGSQAEYGRSDAALTPETPCFPEIGYGMAKLCAGQMSRLECRRLGMAHIWSRIGSVYGPCISARALIPEVVRQLLRGETPALTRGEQVWDFLYADDAADALYKMALSGRDGAIYPLGCGCVRTVREYVEDIRDVVRPMADLSFGAVPYAPNQSMRLEMDISSLREDTGFEPKVDFKEGIRRTAQWLAAQN